ncbi:MAG: polysaccharide biosynthesis C-terminal domain-containing protein [Mailhella sp.]|nr:polysaccharide biosynthesis C-terminal domain-containing protein [Mailhella sp.]
MDTRKDDDLTQGSISKHLIRLTLPLIAGNILQQLYNTIDAFVVARYAGIREFAAIGVAGAVMNLFLFAIAGACIGIAVLLAQAYGAKDLKAFRNEHFIALTMGTLLSTAAGIAAGIAGALGTSPLLALLQTPADIFAFTQSYLHIVLLQTPAAFIYNFYCALFRATGRMKAALAILAFAVCLNLGLDILFVACMGWGVVGAAWATCIAQSVSALLCMLYLRMALPELMFHRENWGLHLPLLRRTAHYGFVTGLQQTGLYIGKLAVQGAVNSMGTATISAYTATTRIEAFVNSFGDSGASATSVIVAQNHGAGNSERVALAFRKSLFLLGLLGIVSSIVLWIAAEGASALLLGEDSGPAFDDAVRYLRIIALFYILNFTGNTLAGYFDGVGRVSVTLLGTCTHIALRAVLCWVFISDFGLNAVAVLTGLGWILVNCIWAVFYYRQKDRK